MSKSVEEVRRELFEEQMDKILCSEGYSDFSLASMMWRGTQGQYYSSRIAGAWEGFNAALDAVEIHLPTPIGDDHGGCIHDAATHDSAVSECRAAIEQTGLGLRVL